MKRFAALFPAATAAISFLVLIPVWADRKMQVQAETSLAEVRVESVEFSSISPDDIVAEVRVSARAKTAAVVHKLVFDGVTIDGIRVHVPPVMGPIHLRAGESIDDMPQIHAVVTYKELETLEPLRRAVREGHASLHGEVHAQLELNMFQKLALMTSSVWVTLPVDQRIAIDLPGGAVGRAAAFATLVAAEPVWIAGQAASEWRQNQSTLAARVRNEMRGRLVDLETRYELRTKQGEHVSMSSRNLGFVTGDGEIVAPGEAAEPWSFDDPLAQALDRGEVTMNDASYDLLATLLEDGPGEKKTYSLQRHELRLVRKLGGGETGIGAGARHRYRIRFRNSDSNAALCEIPALKGSGNRVELARDSKEGSWRPAVVVRLARSGSRSEPTLWLTEARWDVGRYHIKDVVDAAAIGSPLWMENGVVGLLQDESSAAEINGVLKNLR
jgi:hypothetical protein